MTVASEIQRIENNIAAAYTAASGKGATLPATENSANLANCVSSIPSGGDGINREVVNGVYSKPTSNFDFKLPSNATDLENGALYRAFGYDSTTSAPASTGLKSVDISSLTSITGNSALRGAFYGCTGLTSLTMNSNRLSVVSGNNCCREAFYGCTGLTGTKWVSATTISGSGAFYSCYQGCTGITDGYISSVTISGSDALRSCYNGCTSMTQIQINATTVSGSNAMANMCSGCTALTDAYLSIDNIAESGVLNNMFYNCKNLEDVYFMYLDTTSTINSGALSGMMTNTGTDKTHRISFKSGMESRISGLTGYPNFGGTSGYVSLVFDL